MIADLFTYEYAFQNEDFRFVPMYIYGAFAVLAAILVIFLPETVRRRLPETIEDMRKF